MDEVCPRLPTLTDGQEREGEDLDGITRSVQQSVVCCATSTLTLISFWSTEVLGNAHGPVTGKAEQSGSGDSSDWRGRSVVTVREVKSVLKSRDLG